MFAAMKKFPLPFLYKFLFATDFFEIFTNRDLFVFKIRIVTGMIRHIILIILLITGIQLALKRIQPL
jgi:hypothetical protein